MKCYVTFGQVHVHSVNGRTFDKECVAVIQASNPERGREKAFALFGPKFCFCTPQKQFDMDDMKYYPRGLIEVG